MSSSDSEDSVGEAVSDIEVPADDSGAAADIEVPADGSGTPASMELSAHDFGTAAGAEVPADCSGTAASMELSADDSRTAAGVKGTIGEFGFLAKQYAKAALREYMKRLDEESRNEGPSTYAIDPNLIDDPYRTKAGMMEQSMTVWKGFIASKNAVLDEDPDWRIPKFEEDILEIPPHLLNLYLVMVVGEVRGEGHAELSARQLYYLCLGIQTYLTENDSSDNIFFDSDFPQFNKHFCDHLRGQMDVNGIPTTRLEEQALWDTNQLGKHTPYSLLCSIMYFCEVYFGMNKLEDHMKLSFKNMIIVSVKDQDDEAPTTRIRYFPNAEIRCRSKECTRCSADPPDDSEQDPLSGSLYLEKHVNKDDPEKCFVSMYEFYLSKCKPACKNRCDMFYLQPKNRCRTRENVWFYDEKIDELRISYMLMRTLHISRTYDLQAESCECLPDDSEGKEPKSEVSGTEENDD